MFRCLSCVKCWAEYPVSSQVPKICHSLSRGGPSVRTLREVWCLVPLTPYALVVHAWVGQIITFFAYSPPSLPLGSLTPTQP